MQKGMKWPHKDSKLTLVDPIQIYFRLVVSEYHYTLKDTVKLFNILFFVVHHYQTSITVYFQTPAHIWITTHSSILYIKDTNYGNIGNTLLTASIVSNLKALLILWKVK